METNFEDVLRNACENVEQLYIRLRTINQSLTHEQVMTIQVLAQKYLWTSVLLQQNNQALENIDKLQKLQEAGDPTRESQLEQIIGAAITGTPCYSVDSLVENQALQEKDSRILFFEYKSGLRIRQKQANIINKILGPLNKKIDPLDEKVPLDELEQNGLVFQLIMGGWKNQCNFILSYGRNCQ